MKSKSIQFKIITAIIAVLLVSIVTSIILTSENQKGNLLSTARQTLAVNTEMLNQVIRNIMLSGEAPIATRTLTSIKGLEEFEEVEIYRSNGTVAFSDYGTVDFVNEFQDKIRFDYTDRSEDMMINNDAFQMVLQSNTPLVRELKDTQEMEYFFPILNYAECRVCHGDENFIRGVSHFKISIKNIYDKVNFARIVLTVFFIIIGILLFFILLYLLRKLIIDKILSIGKAVSIVATGDLDIQIEMDSEDELGTLSNQINLMISSLKDKKQLEIENALIESSLKENQKYLKNIQEGLLLVDKDLIINENYSKYLKEMFGDKEIAGQKLTDFLFENSEEFSTIRGDLEMFISLLFNNITADMDMIKDINPLLDCWIEGKDGKILIDAFVQRIFDEKDTVENVMIIFKDKTTIFYAEKELEKERQRSMSELDHIASLLNVGPDTFMQFIDEAESVLSQFKENLKA
ncbi:MAG: HAMP domain-containing protein [Spirochaetaceae bacterium]|nr:HAMP domain-containing protein [Spirochaetaceae bacterium]